MRKLIIAILLLVSCTNLLAQDQEGNKLKLDSLKKLINRLESEIKIKSDSLHLLKTESQSLRLKINMANSNPSNEYPFNILAISSLKGSLYDSTSFSSNKITTIEKNTEIVLLNYTHPYWLVKYENYIGYCNSVFIENGDKYIRFIRGEIDSTTLRENAPTKKQIELHNKLKEEKKAALLKKREEEIRVVNKKIEDENKRAEAENNLNITHDDFTKRTHYEDKKGYSFYGSTWGMLSTLLNLYFYIPYNSTKAESLQFTIYYLDNYKKNLRFVNEVTFLIDGKQYKIKGDFESEGRSYAAEYIIKSVDYSIHQLLKAIMNGDSMKIRFSSDKNYNDAIIDPEQVEAIKRIYNLYIEKGGKF